MRKRVCRLKVLHIVESLEFGGLEKLVVYLCKWQAKHGYVVDILSLSESNPLYEDSLKKMGVNIIVRAKKRGVDIHLAAYIIKIVAKNRYDVVHTHNALANYYGCFYRLLPTRKAKLINTRHGMGEVETGGRKETIYKVSARFTDTVVFVTSVARDAFVKERIVSPKKAATIMNGIEPRVDMGKQLDKAALFPSIKGRSCVLGTVARLSPVKNQVYLLEILRELVKREGMTDYHLVIVGDGPMRQTLEQHVRANALSERVHFTGMQSSTIEYLRVMDAFVLTSLSEGIPLTIVEAMELGKVVFSTPVGGIVEIIKDRQNGIFIPLDDAAGAAGIIDSCLWDSDLVHAVSSREIDYYHSHLTIDVMARKYSEIYGKRVA